MSTREIGDPPIFQAFSRTIENLLKEHKKTDFQMKKKRGFLRSKFSALQKGPVSARNGQL